MRQKDVPAGPYTSAMSTDDDLRKAGQAAAALMGVAAARARQVADQLLRPSDRARQEAKNKAEALADEGRRAAADIVSALRREVAVVFGDLERLEGDLRGGRPTETRPAATVPTPAGHGRPSGGPSEARKSPPAARKVAGARGTGSRETSQAARAGQSAKAAGPARAAGPSKTAGRAKAAAKVAGATKAGTKAGGRVAKAAPARTAATKASATKASATKASATKASAARKTAPRRPASPGRS